MPKLAIFVFIFLAVMTASSRSHLQMAGESGQLKTAAVHTHPGYAQIAGVNR